MRKIFLIFSCILLFLFSANSQVKFGVKAGASISDRTGDNVSNEKSLTALQASGFAIVFLGKSLILQPSLGCYPKGNRYTHINFVDFLGNDHGTGDVHFRFDYIEFATPFQYLVATNERIKFYSGLGPYFSYAVGGKALWKHVTGQATDEEKKRKLIFGNYGFKRGDVGIAVLLSAQIQKQWILSLNYDQGLINTNSNSNTIESHNMSAGLTIGYVFK